MTTQPLDDEQPAPEDYAPDLGEAAPEHWPGSANLTPPPEPYVEPDGGDER